MENKFSIMLIDDNEFDLFLNEKFIESKNLSQNISKYEYAMDALNYLEGSTIEDWPNVILLDIQMPMMNGFEFVDKYKDLDAQKRKKTSIVMVSSSLDKNDNFLAKNSPYVLALLTKPLNMDHLIDLLKTHNIV